jgi:hypothetical protein
MGFYPNVAAALITFCCFEQCGLRWVTPVANALETGRLPYPAQLSLPFVVKYRFVQNATANNAWRATKPPETKAALQPNLCAKILVQLF